MAYELLVASADRAGEPEAVSEVVTYLPAAAQRARPGSAPGVGRAGTDAPEAAAAGGSRGPGADRGRHPGGPRCQQPVPSGADRARRGDPAPARRYGAADDLVAADAASRFSGTASLHWAASTPNSAAARRVTSSKLYGTGWRRGCGAARTSRCSPSRSRCTGAPGGCRRCRRCCTARPAPATSPPSCGKGSRCGSPTRQAGRCASSRCCALIPPPSPFPRYGPCCATGGRTCSTVFLAGSPPRGKFLAAGVRWVPLNASGTDRWLPRQQAAYAGLLARTAADAGAKIYLRTGAIAAAARLGDAGWDVVHRYVGSPNTNLAEAALAALARADRPGDALPVLLSHAGDDQARVSYLCGRPRRPVHPAPAAGAHSHRGTGCGRQGDRPQGGAAARRALVGPGRREHLAQRMDASKVSTATSGPRLSPLPAAGCTTLPHGSSSTRQPSGSPEEALAIVAMTDPLQCAPRHRRHYGTLVAQACRSSDQHTARKAWQALPGWAHWTPDISALVTARLTTTSGPHPVAARRTAADRGAGAQAGPAPCSARSPVSWPTLTARWPAATNPAATVPRGSG